MRALPELRDVNSDQQNKGLEARSTSIGIRRRGWASAADIDNASYDAFGQRQVSTMYGPQPVSRHDGSGSGVFQQTGRAAEHLRSLLHRSGGSARFLCSFAPSNTPLAVNHQGQYPSVTLSFNLAPEVSLGKRRGHHNAERPWISPHQCQLSGNGRRVSDSLSSQPLLILAALVTVYIVLGVLYESYIHPITILSTLPSAGVGAMLALLITHSELNVIGLIGIILLIGIVKKNAIMMIDFALETESEGKSLGLHP